LEVSRKRRRRRLAVACLCSGAFLVSCHAALGDYATGLAKGEPVFVPNPVFEMKGATPNQDVSHTFRVYNLRPQWLQVEAEPDCGCIGTSWQKATIAPFSWKALAVQTKAKPKGEQEQSVNIAVRTSNAQKPYIFASVVQ